MLTERTAKVLDDEEDDEDYVLTAIIKVNNFLGS